MRVTLEKYDNTTIEIFDCENIDDIAEKLIRRDDYDHIAIRGRADFFKTDKWVAFSTVLMPWNNNLWYRYQGVWSEDSGALPTVYIRTSNRHIYCNSMQFSQFTAKALGAGLETVACGAFIENKGMLKLSETFKTMLRDKYPNLV